MLFGKYELAAVVVMWMLQEELIYMHLFYIKRQECSSCRGNAQPNHRYRLCFHTKKG